MEAWILENAIQAVVLAIVESKSLETVERWQFNIECEPATEATYAFHYCPPLWFGNLASFVGGVSVRF